MKAFKFKRFELHQDQCAMKIGTDGCLLGAWAMPFLATKALDIGTGTGLIACMLAQRFPALSIDAIDINQAAAAQAKSNAAASPFAHQIQVQHLDLHQVKSKDYDYIVCNPPFFEELSSSAQESSRITARQETALTIQELFERAFQLSTATARLAIVWPARREDEACELARIVGWHVMRRCELYPTPTKDCHRVLLEFSKEKQEVIQEKIIIEKYGRHHYSEEYISLLKAFYLKF